MLSRLFATTRSMTSRESTPTERDSRPISFAERDLHGVERIARVLEHLGHADRGHDELARRWPKTCLTAFGRTRVVGAIAVNGGLS